MTTAPTHGDVLIRVVGESSYQLVDATSRRQIVIAPDLHVAVKVASEYGGAVWRDNVDSRGRSLGDPVLLVPRASLAQIVSDSADPRTIPLGNRSAS